MPFLVGLGEGGQLGRAGARHGRGDGRSRGGSSLTVGSGTSGSGGLVGACGAEHGEHGQGGDGGVGRGRRRRRRHPIRSDSGTGRCGILISRRARRGEQLGRAGLGTGAATDGRGGSSRSRWVAARAAAADWWRCLRGGARWGGVVTVASGEGTATSAASRFGRRTRGRRAEWDAHFPSGSAKAGARARWSSRVRRRTSRVSR